MKLVKKCYLILVILALFSVPNKVHAQFWGGFLQGVGAALQNYNNQQRYNNYQSSQNYVKKAPVEKREIRKNRQKESDGFEWIEVSTWNGHTHIYGALNNNSESIIPQKYSLIVYHTTCGGWFQVRLKDKEGVYDINGHRICEAIYDDVSYRKEGDVAYVKVKINEKTGIVGENGQYIVQPSMKYNDYISYSEARGTFYYENSQGDYVDLGIDIEGNVSNNESSTFSLASEMKHKIIKTFIEDESRDFIGNGDVMIGKNILVINLGLIKQEYKYIGKPKQTPGLKIWTVDAVYNGTTGKLDFADLEKEIMIKPSGFNMPMGYIVKR